MKNLKKLTRNERKIAHSWGLNPDEWKREKTVGKYLLLRNINTNEQKEILAMVRGR